MLRENIYHSGIVKRITNKTIEVAITPVTACQGCHAKSFCQMADQEQKVISVEAAGLAVVPGERVNVVMKASLGLHAVLVAYVLPVLLVIMVLIAGVAASLEEVYIALASLGVMVIYFILIYLLRDRMKKRFSFSIHKP